jgi:hypothetical protein
MPESLLNLPEILASHARWLACDPSGQRANLNRANLNRANLDGANLNGASLNRASLDGANLSRANLNGASLNRASLDGANLSRASLIGASLDGANLSGASLIGASLNRASLDGANLSRASLIGASLDGANLDGATGIVIAADAPQRLRAAAAAALQEGALEMGAWHSRDTTHCLGGWLIHQAGEVGRLLEATVGPGIAGLMLGGVEAHSHFYDSNEAATEWLRSVLAQPEAKS